MTEFTLLDGVYLMVVAMSTVFLLLACLNGLLVIIGKLVDRYQLPKENTQADSSPNITPVVSKGAEKQLPPEKVALIMSLVFTRREREKNNN